MSAKAKTKQKKKSQPRRTEVQVSPAEGQRGQQNRQVQGEGEGEGKAQELRCNVCQRDFNSRNKLFQHIKDTGHALKLDGPVQQPDHTTKNKKRKRKK